MGSGVHLALSAGDESRHILEICISRQGAYHCGGLAGVAPLSNLGPRLFSGRWHRQDLVG